MSMTVIFKAGVLMSCYQFLLWANRFSLCTDLIYLIFVMIADTFRKEFIPFFLLMHSKFRIGNIQFKRSIHSILCYILINGLTIRLDASLRMHTTLWWISYCPLAHTTILRLIFVKCGHSHFLLCFVLNFDNISIYKIIIDILASWWI